MINLVNNILYEESTYGTITLNRPEKRNAISRDMASQLNDLLDRLIENPPKFLVIKSAGEGVFCAGGDLTELHGDLDADEAYERLTPMRELLFKIATFPVPVIALLQGNALGGGCELATACDIRIAKENTKFGFIQTNLGILPGWGGGALLFKKVHPTFALQWISEGAIFSATDLRTKGWLHHMVPEADWTDENAILHPYLKKSKTQLQFIKQQLLNELNVSDLKDKMVKESRQSAELWPSEEHKRAVQQFLNK